FRSSGNLSIRVYATSNPYVADQWTSNSSALSQMNQSANCGEPIFIDPFESPYQGVIPPNSNVLAFVQHSPNFTGTLSGLCERGAVFVLFGNYHDGFSSSMFGNSCTDCTRHIEIQLGTCNYDIVYEPELLTGGNGAFIEGNGGSISYGNSPGCKPSFHHFPTPPAPIPDRDNISICENETVATEAINITNGNSYTSWHLNPDGPPIHYGSSFVPDLTFFFTTHRKYANRTKSVCSQYRRRTQVNLERNQTNQQSRSRYPRYFVIVRSETAMRIVWR